MKRPPIPLSGTSRISKCAEFSTSRITQHFVSTEKHVKRIRFCLCWLVSLSKHVFLSVQISRHRFRVSAESDGAIMGLCFANKL